MLPLPLALGMLLPLSALAAERAGQTPPAPTAANQEPVSGVTAPFVWQLAARPYTVSGGQVTFTLPVSGSTLNATSGFQVNGSAFASGTTSGVTVTGSIVTGLRAPALGVSRLADFSLSATGNGGSGTQVLVAGAAWTRYVLDTQNAGVTTSAALAGQFTPANSRFLAEAVGKAYLFRMAYNVALTANGSGYLEFAFDTSAAGDGSSIKSTTPVYVAGSALAATSYLFDNQALLVARTSASTTAPGPVLLVRFVGSGTLTLSGSGLTIVDASGVSNN